MDVTGLWWSTNEDDWKECLERYWDNVKNENIELEKKMDCLDPLFIKAMTVDEFYIFLYNEYYVWKYTAKNRLATTRHQLQRYETENRTMELKLIKDNLFTFDLNDIKRGLEIGYGIRGLGIAGASGLLSILFPQHFATVDQFVVKALNDVMGIPGKRILAQMNPEGLNLNDGVMLIKIMKNKTDELNKAHQTTFWTPRKIDKILWTVGH